MRFEEATDYLYGLIDYEKITRFTYDFDLNKFEDFLARVDNPHRKLKRSVLVAGTKGKGSTAAMISSALQAAGLQVGLFTSPHLVTVRERIRVNGQMIPEEDFAALIAELKPHIEDELHCYYRTVFEILTTMAFLYFYRQGVDFAILEAGLGGRLDSTNVVHPLLSVITPISYDHTEVLGDTLTEIATEKAGIIREGGIVVSSPQPEEAKVVIERTCVEKKARLILVGRDLTYEVIQSDLRGNTFRVKGSFGEEEVFIPLLGRQQVENAATVWAALEALQAGGLGLEREAIKEGLARVHFPGRLEVVRRSPWLVLDGAHNEDSARKLAAAIRELFHYGKLILLLGILEGKDIPGIVSCLAPMADAIIVAQPDTPRAADPGIIVREVQRWDKPYQVAKDTGLALERAQAMAGPEDLILVTGSLYLVGEVIRAISS